MELRIEKGIEYKLEFFNIKISLDNGVSFIDKKVEFTVCIPKDYDDMLAEAVIIRYPNILYDCTVQDSMINRPFCHIRYVDVFNLRGKYKCKVLHEKSCELKISDFPDMIDCSLNTQVHPKERNWWLVKNCGLIDVDDMDINWEVWKEYDIMWECESVLLYYKILAELTYSEMNKIGVHLASFLEWKELIAFQYSMNNYYYYNYNFLNNLQDNYLRDILRLWD